MFILTLLLSRIQDLGACLILTYTPPSKSVLSLAFKIFLFIYYFFKTPLFPWGVAALVSASE